jgi:hypothetical protein
MEEAMANVRLTGEEMREYRRDPFESEETAVSILDGCIDGGQCLTAVEGENGQPVSTAGADHLHVVITGRNPRAQTLFAVRRKKF